LKLRTIFIFLLISITVALKITANSAYFLTPDSHHYLYAAENLLNGKGYYINFQGENVFCAIWPVGYSLLIATVAFLTKLSPEISSKIVNLLAVAGMLWLIWVRFKEKSWVVSMLLLSSTFLQIYSNTWSETLFLFCVLGFVLYVEKTNSHTLYWGIFAFLTRYAGAFLLIPLLLKKQWKTVSVFVVIMAIYLLNNYFFTHTLTGIRGYAPTEPFEIRLFNGFKDLGQEIAFWGVRDWDLKTGNEAIKAIVYVVATLQMLILIVVSYRILPEIKKTKFAHKNDLVINAGLVSLSYLVFTISLYFLDDSIETLSYRRLAPFTFFALFAGLAWLCASQQNNIFQKTKWWVVAFFILSTVHALPKMFIFGF
jgi:hypothetical protein